MKLHELALALTVAALLPTLAHAATDKVVASFDRDLHHEPSNSAVMIADAADPLSDAVKIALYGATDQVLASFERDLAA